jgi:hypothetical protein
MRVEETVEEYHFCGALVDQSPDSTVTEGVNENLEENLRPEIAALFSKERNPFFFCLLPKRSDLK